MNINLAKNIDVNKLTFSEMKKNDYGGGSLYVNYENRPLVIQTPYMSTPFGVSVFEPNDGGPSKYSLDLSFRDEETNKSVGSLLTMLNAFDEKLIQEGLKNSLQWFKTKHTSAEVIKAL